MSPKLRANLYKPPDVFGRFDELSIRRDENLSHPRILSRLPESDFSFDVTSFEQIARMEKAVAKNGQLACVTQATKLFPAIIERLKEK
jgi:hypothetical protein